MNIVTTIILITIPLGDTNQVVYSHNILLQNLLHRFSLSLTDFLYDYCRRREKNENIKKLVVSCDGSL